MPAVRERQVDLVEGEQGNGDDGGQHHDGSDQAIDRNTACFHCGQFAGPGQGAKGDQHREESAERCEVIEHVRNQVQQVVAYCDQCSAVSDDVAEQFKEAEKERQHDEADQDEGKRGEEFPQNVIIEDEREAVWAPQRGTKLLLCLLLAGTQTFERGPDPIQQVQQAGIAGGQVTPCHAPQQKQAKQGEDEVGAPHTEHGAHLALLGERHTDG